MQINDSFLQPVPKRDATDAQGVSVADTLLGLGASAEISAAPEINECPACQYTREDFDKTGLFGCPQCYVTFSEGLGEMLKGIHVGIQHAGKVPAHFARSLARNAEATL